MIPAFLLTFREALEAALIVAILLGYLAKVGRRDIYRHVAMGTVVAAVASVVLGAALLRVYGGLAGITEQLFEAGASLLAAAVLTHMIFWMAGNAKRIRGELEGKMEGYITRGFLVGITLLAFIAVFREGVETVLFLLAAFFVDSSGTLLGALLGVAVVLALGFIMMRSIARLPVQKFFQYTSILLLIFAAGIAGHGVHEAMEAAETGGWDKDHSPLGAPAFDLNPPPNPDGSYPALHEDGAIGSVFKALVGYTGNPEWLRVIVYLGYWAVVGTFLLRAYRPRVPAPSTANGPTKGP